jgi:glycosyltransferase involved in cell wall biosynthesis
MTDARRKRILVLNAGGEWYGSDKVLYHVVELLAERHECLVVLPFAGILDRRLRELGVRCVVMPYAVVRRRFFTPWGVPFWITSFAASIVPLAVLARRFRPDVVFSNSISVLEGVPLSALSGARHVWHMHDVLVHPRCVAAALRWIARRFAHQLICVSSVVARYVGPGAHVVTVHNGVPAALDQPVFRRKQPGSLSLGVVGRFNAFKGQIDLLKAVTQLNHQDPALGSQLRVLLAGGVFGNDYRWLNAVKEFVSAHRLKSQVEIRPFTEDIASVYGQLDLLVVPSTQPDTFPTVALEAMSCGVPVLAYRNGGVEEILADVPSCLVDLNDVRALADSIRRFAGDEQHRLDIARRQHERYLKHFTLERFRNRFVAAIAL